MTIKQKTINGLTWSFIDNTAKLGLTFIIGIILARLLSPREFGLIGMITIFIALSQSLVDSDFTRALIRKKDCTQADYFAPSSQRTFDPSHIYEVQRSLRLQHYSLPTL